MDWLVIETYPGVVFKKIVSICFLGIQCKFGERIHPRLRFDLFLEINRWRWGFYKKS